MKPVYSCWIRRITILCIVLLLFTVVLSSFVMAFSDEEDNHGVLDRHIGEYNITIEVYTGSSDFDWDYNEKITWWISADPHIGHNNYDLELERAVEDIKNINTDFAVVLGDIVHDDLESVP